jgi:hypothetical protein
MVLNTEAKDYKQINYTVPFCEYNNQIENFEEKALSMNKFQEFKKIDKNMRGVFGWIATELEKFETDEFKNGESEKKEAIINKMTRAGVRSGKISQKEKKKIDVAVTQTKELLRSCAEQMVALRKFYLWMKEMRRKEMVVTRIVDGIIARQGSMSPFKKFVIDAMNNANSSEIPMGMSPIFMVWIELLKYTPRPGEITVQAIMAGDIDPTELMKLNQNEAKKREALNKQQEQIESKFYLELIWPELKGTIYKKKGKGAEAAQLRVARKHIYQYHVRYDIFTPRTLLNYFHTEARIDHMKFEHLTKFRNECLYSIQNSINSMKQNETVSAPPVVDGNVLGDCCDTSPAEASLPVACPSCLEMKNLNKCSSCDVLYCSERCSNIYWPIHKNICPGAISRRDGQPCTPWLVDSNGEELDFMQEEDDALCDQTKEYELFRSVTEQADSAEFDKENIESIEKFINKKFEIPSVKNKGTIKKKGRKKRK